MANVADREADLDIFDVIGDPWDGTTAKDFIAELRNLDVDRIRLHINSPGGFVNDALAMFNALQSHPAEVIAYVESEAASAASFVLQAADKRVMFKNAKVFIHDASGFGIGNASDFRALADMLDEESENIATIYAERSGKTVAYWREQMQASDGIGSTYRGQAAVDIGLADEVATAPARNARPLRVAAQADPVSPLPPAPEDPFANITIPPLADHAGYKKPLPDLAGLMEKHPLKVGGK